MNPPGAPQTAPFLAQFYRHGLLRLALDIARARGADVTNGTFDTVICINTLHHITPEDLPDALRALGRAARRDVILEIKNWENFYYRIVRTGGGRRSSAKVGAIEVYPTTVRAVEDIMRPLGLERKATKPLWLWPILSPLLVLHFGRTT